MAYRRLQNDRFVDDATGIVYEDRPGIGLVAVGDASGAARVSNSFVPSIYTGRVTSSEDGTTFAISAGASHLLIQSLDMAAAGTAEYAVLAFGTSAADAQVNLGKSGTTPNIIANNGIVIGSSTFVAGHTLDPIKVPANATHAAIGNGVAATTIALMVTQGQQG